MRLRLFRFIESVAKGTTVYAPPEGMQILKEVRDTPDKKHKKEIEFRLRTFATCHIDDTPEGLQRAEARAAKLLARYMYSDLREEILDLSDYAFKNGGGAGRRESHNAPLEARRRGGRRRWRVRPFNTATK